VVGFHYVTVRSGAKCRADQKTERGRARAEHEVSVGRKRVKAGGRGFEVRVAINRKRKAILSTRGSPNSVWEAAEKVRLNLCGGNLSLRSINWGRRGRMRGRRSWRENGYR